MQVSLRELGTGFANWFEGYLYVFFWQTNWLDAPIFTLILVVVGYFILFAVLTYWGKELLETLLDWFVHRKKLRQDEEYKNEWFGKPWRVRHPRVFLLILYVVFVFLLLAWIIITDPM